MLNIELKNNVDEVIERGCRFYDNGTKSGTLIYIQEIEEIKTPALKPLNEWDFDNELHAFLDERIERLAFVSERRRHICDDYIPSVAPNFGIAEHSAYLGGKVNVEKTTSYHEHILEKIEDYKFLDLDENNKWFRYVMDGLAYLREKTNGRCAVRMRGGCSPSELAYFLRGNDVFTDFYEYPDELKGLLDFCVEAEKWFIEEQIKAGGGFAGGIVVGFDVWLPGYSFGHLSEDWATMCSADIYRQFGKPYTEKIITGFDHILMHTHSFGRHTLPDIAAIEGVDVIQISSDPQCPSAISVFKEYRDCLKNKKVVISDPSFDEIKENTEFLKEHKTIIHYKAKTVEEAEFVTGFIKKEFSF